MSFSTKHIGYLERDYLDNSQGKVENDLKDFLIPESKSIRLVKILGIPRFWEQNEEKIASLSCLLEDVIAGFFGEKTPLIYLITGEKSQINLFLGTYQANNSLTEELQTNGGNLSTIATSLKSVYPGIALMEQEENDFQDVLKLFNFAGIVMGTPTVKFGDEEIRVEQIERLIRGLYGRSWGYMVVAIPMAEDSIRRLYNSTLNELRIVSDAEKSADKQSPIAGKYKELLEIFLKKIEIGKMQGMWHTAVYHLAQDARTFQHAKAIVKSVFGGEESLPDPVRVLDCSHIKDKIHKFAQITTSAPPALGQIQYPYKYLNLLNSKELTSQVHLPTEEVPGYFVRDYARFDVASHYKGNGEAINIGEIIDQGNRMGYDYKISLGELNRHGLIVGTTGSGKTNTIFHLIKQIWQEGTPFMVIEPAKIEYRKLLESELGENLQIFTLGDDNVSPFRLNPFEIMPGVSVQTHIDHLKSVFNASFIMYAPMPYVLERCIHEIYEDKGWDLVTNENRRGLHRDAQPTLTNLYRKIDDVVDRLGYEPKVTMDVKAALKTRINSLRIGGKGLMLDTRQSIPIEAVLKKPTILELEQIGDDDEKAFIIGLLLAFLYEHYVAGGLKEGAPLSHITIVEEAHRLFKNIPSLLDTEVANIKGKAVETFCNILSEVRAYGEGFLIAEQIPIKLAPDTVKNTNLKIMHRIVSEEDRDVMGGTMILDDDEKRRIASLNIGEAAVYSEGNDGAILTKIPYSKIESQGNSRDDEKQIIQGKMEKIAEKMSEVFVPFSSCTDYCRDICQYKKEAVAIVEDHEFKEALSRYIISVVRSDQALTEEIPTILQSINRLRKSNDPDTGVVVCALINGIEQYFEYLGRMYGWKYSDVDKLKSDFVPVVHDVVIDEKISEKNTSRLKLFRKKYSDLCKRNYVPFLGCESVCPGGICLYRYNIHPLLGDRRLDSNFTNTFANYSGNEMWQMLGKISQTVIRRTISNSVPSEDKQEIALCFAVQKSEMMPYLDSFLREKIVSSMINLFNIDKSFID